MRIAMRRTEERIRSFEFGLPWAIDRLSGRGNADAAKICAKLATVAPEIDPESALGAWTPLVELDTYGFYGPAIVKLWRDCGENLVRMLGVLRSMQLGFIGATEVADDLDERKAEYLLQKVKRRLKRFGVKEPRR
jgi:hypothetical protein